MYSSCAGEAAIDLGEKNELRRQQVKAQMKQIAANIA